MSTRLVKTIQCWLLIKIYVLFWKTEIVVFFSDGTDRGCTNKKRSTYWVKVAISNDLSCQIYSFQNFELWPRAEAGLKLNGVNMIIFSQNSILTILICKILIVAPWFATHQTKWLFVNWITYSSLVYSTSLAISHISER